MEMSPMLCITSAEFTPKGKNMTGQSITSSRHLFWQKSWIKNSKCRRPHLALQKPISNKAIIQLLFPPL